MDTSRTRSGARVRERAYWEGVEVPLGIVAIEWAERLRHRPADYLQVCLTYQADYSRRADLPSVGIQLDYRQLLM